MVLSSVKQLLIGTYKIYQLITSVKYIHKYRTEIYFYCCRITKLECVEIKSKLSTIKMNQTHRSIIDIFLYLDR